MGAAFGASVAGTSHHRTGLPCQDAHGFRLLERATLAAVADGLGSAACAQEGAERAVQSLLTELEAVLSKGLPTDAAAWQSGFLEAFAIVRQQLEAAAQAVNRPLRDYATTLLAAVVTAEGVAFAHIGDGAVVAQWGDGAVETISPPQRGEYANEVVPITAPNALTQIRCGQREAAVRGVALFTDGLQHLALNLASGAAYAPFFAPLFAALEPPVDAAAISAQLAAFLDSERINAKTDDDKTLLIVNFTPPTRSEEP